MAEPKHARGTDGTITGSLATSLQALRMKLKDRPPPHLVMAYVINPHTLTATETARIETLEESDAEFRRELQHLRKNKQLYSESEPI